MEQQQGKQMMASMTLDLVQQLVDRLSASEQAQLLAYLAPKLASAVAVAEAVQPQTPATWDEFFVQGDSLEDDPSDLSMTAAVTAMRR